MANATNTPVTTTNPQGAAMPNLAMFANQELATKVRNTAAMLIVARQEVKKASAELNKAQAKHSKAKDADTRIKLAEDLTKAQDNFHKAQQRVAGLEGVKGRLKKAVDTAAVEAVLAGWQSAVGGRQVVDDGATNFDLTQINELVDLALSETGSQDRGVVEMSVKAQGLIRLVNMLKVLEATAEDTTDFGVALRHAVYTLKTNKTTKATLGNHWHMVFGGNIKNSRVMPEEEFLGINLEDIRNRFKPFLEAGKANLPANPKSVFVDEAAVKVTLSPKFQARFSWKVGVSYASFINQIIFLTVDKNATVKFSTKERFGTLQRLAGLARSKVELSGLKDNPNYHVAVRVGFGGNTFESVTLLKDPFLVQVREADRTDEQVTIAQALYAKGYGLSANPDLYGKHSYIQDRSTYMTVDSGFLAKTGSGWESVEDVARLVVRQVKQANAKHIWVFPNVVTRIVAACDVADLPTMNSAEASAQAKLNSDIEKAFVAGGAIAGLSHYGLVGPCRFVSGKNIGDTGQKSVIADPYFTCPESLTNLVPVDGVLVGRNSTKSSGYKADGSNCWTLQHIKNHGYVWVSETVEDHYITDSYLAEAYRRVPTLLEGTNVVLDSLERAINGKKNPTVAQMLYGYVTANPMATLDDAVNHYLATNTIETKPEKVTLNSQVNAGLPFQYGNNGSSEIFKHLIANNKAATYRKNFRNVLQLASGQISSAGIAHVNAIELVRSVAEDAASRGVLEAMQDGGKVQSVYVVKSVIEQLAIHNKPWVNFDLGHNVQVLIPITQDLVDGIELTDRVNYVALEGFLADIFQAISAYFSYITVEYSEFGAAMCNINSNMTEVAAKAVAERLIAARDRIGGKPLSQIPAIGTYTALATSCLLKGNQMISPTMLRLRKQAGRSFHAGASVIYFKPPVLWKGSITAVDLVNPQGNSAFFISDEYHETMLGRMAFISAEKAVKNGNDVDGDRQGLICVPTNTLKGTLLSKPEVFVDATDERFAAGARKFKEHWESELSGLYFKASVAKVAKAVTPDEYHNALARAVIEKANVARYTSAQTMTLTSRGVYTEAVTHALQSISHQHVVSDMKGWVKEVLDDSRKVNALAEAIWSFACDIQGTCVNLDALDQVKSSDGREIKKLAELLSPTELKFVNFQWLTKLAPEDSRVQPQEAVKKIGERALTLRKLMFSAEYHNISLEQVRWIMPQVKDEVLYYFLAYVMTFAGSNVGMHHATTFDITKELMNKAGEYNGNRTGSNIQTLIADLTEEGKVMVKDDCIQRTISALALAYANKHLV